jgi:tRNA-2-methylthio-N6-dimethylallyladenosine synthase
MGAELVNKAPVIDLMFSSFNIHQLPQLIQQAQAGYKAIAILEEPPEDEDKLWEYPTVRDNQYCAYVTVMKGMRQKLHLLRGAKDPRKTKVKEPTEHSL